LFLKDYLKEIQEDPVRNKFCKVKVLCRTLAENLVHLITITNQTSNVDENKAKKGRFWREREEKKCF
jgi:hypothetical protein